MRSCPLLVVCSFFPFLLGCGKTLDEPVDPARATELLNTVFEAWKQGGKHADLAKQQPPVYFAEREWETGKKLVKYEIGPVTLTGRQGRCTVKLTLHDDTGKVTDRAIGYQIDTTPSLVITREALGP